MLRAELVRVAICFSRKVYESIVPLLGEPRLKTTTRESIADREFQSSVAKKYTTSLKRLGTLRLAVVQIV